MIGLKKVYICWGCCGGEGGLLDAPSGGVVKVAKADGEYSVFTSNDEFTPLVFLCDEHYCSFCFSFFLSFFHATTRNNGVVFLVVLFARSSQGQTGLVIGRRCDQMWGAGGRRKV